MNQGRRERILDEAAQWMALLQSGHAGAEERLAFQQWRQADAEHGAVSCSRFATSPCTACAPSN